MTNPFKHDDDSDAEAADQRLTEQMGEDIERGKPDVPVGPGEDGDIEVSMEAPPSKDEEEEETRLERKRNRYKDQQERADVAEQRAEQLTIELAAARAVQHQMPQRETPQEDPYQKALDDTYAERTRLAETFQLKQTAGSLSEEESASLLKKGRELEEKSNEIQFARFQQRQAQNTDPRAATKQMVFTRHPDIAANPQALAWADGEAKKRMSVGEKYSVDMVDEVMEDARKQFRLGRHKHGPVADDAQRARYIGGPRGPGPTSAPAKPKKVTMTRAMRQMADQAFPSIRDPKERYKKWAEKAGPRFMELENEGGT